MESKIIHLIVGQIRKRLDMVDANPTREELKLFLVAISSKIKIRAVLRALFDLIKAENLEIVEQANQDNAELDAIDLEDII